MVLDLLANEEVAPIDVLRTLELVLHNGGSNGLHQCGVYGTVPGYPTIPGGCMDSNEYLRAMPSTVRAGRTVGYTFR